MDQRTEEGLSPQIREVIEYWRGVATQALGERDELLAELKANDARRKAINADERWKAVDKRARKYLSLPPEERPAVLGIRKIDAERKAHDESLLRLPEQKARPWWQFWRSSKPQPPKHQR